MNEEYLTTEAGSGPPPLPPPARTPVGLRKPPKSPAAATLLSLFPGLGQIYNGQPAKALVFFLAWAGSIAAASQGEPMPFALFVPFIYLYNMVDAWRGASQANARAAGGIQEPDESTAESPAWGGALIVLGLLLLLRNLGWISLAALTRYWPVLLIAAGAALLSSSLRLRRERDGGGL